MSTHTLARFPASTQLASTPLVKTCRAETVVSICRTSLRVANAQRRERNAPSAASQIILPKSVGAKVRKAVTARCEVGVAAIMAVVVVVMVAMIVIIVVMVIGMVAMEIGMVATAIVMVEIVVMVAMVLGVVVAVRTIVTMRATALTTANVLAKSTLTWTPMTVKECPCGLS